MSMISEQVKRLRKIAMDAKTYPYISAQCTEAADVIEELSSKLQAANMERSSQYYNGGWIPVSEKLPEEDGEYLVTVKGMRNYIKCCYFARNLYLVDEYDFVDKKGVAGFYKYDSEYGFYEVTEVIAWCELPEPYKMCGGEE